MAIGTVKWFNPTKGYGFIQPDNGGKDVFVHISAVEKAGLSNLNEGAKVSYEEMSNRGKSSAENLRVGQINSNGPSRGKAGAVLCARLRNGGGPKRIIEATLPGRAALITISGTHAHFRSNPDTLWTYGLTNWDRLCRDDEVRSILKAIRFGRVERSQCSRMHWGRFLFRLGPRQ